MARRKTLPDSVRVKYTLAERLASLRAELYGDRGGPELARRLGLPVRTWYNYESGVTVPAEVILKIIELTSAEPMWLLHGRGTKYRAGCERPDPGGGPGVSVGSLLRTAIKILERGELAAPGAVVPAGPGGDQEGGEAPSRADSGGPAEGMGPNPRPSHVGARSEWNDAERECRCIRIEGDAMSPIVADGAYVAFAPTEVATPELDGKMVVAWLDGQPLVRWFQFCGRYAVLRAENPGADPVTTLVDLEDPTRETRFRRVLWINTPH